MVARFADLDVVACSIHVEFVTCGVIEFHVAVVIQRVELPMLVPDCLVRLSSSCGALLFVRRSCGSVYLLA